MKISPHRHNPDGRREEWQAPGVIARGYKCSNAHQVEVRAGYNGSGDGAFGGAKQWPVVDSEVSFQEGEWDKAVAFAKAQRKLIDEFFKGKS